MDKIVQTHGSVSMIDMAWKEREREKRKQRLNKLDLVKVTMVK